MWSASPSPSTAASPAPADRDLKALAAVFLAAALALGKDAAADGRSVYDRQDFDVLQYDVDLRPDFDRGEISGETRVRFRSGRDGLTAIRFTANAFMLAPGTRFGIKGHSGPLEIIPDGGDMIFVIPPMRNGQTAEFHMSYAGKPGRGLTIRPGYIYAEYFACQWMVCRQDEPGDKARFRLSLTMAPRRIMLGPGELVSRTARKDGTEKITWEERRPHSAYLFGFIAGQLNSDVGFRNGRASSWHLSPTASGDELRKLFEPSPDMLAFFEDKAGSRLPHAYIQLHVPGAAAQEAMNYSVLGDDVLQARLKDPQEDWAIAHEMAHQWWGNSITCASWDHFWLNEGVTTFMVAAWKEHRWGRAAYDREMDLLRQRVAAAGIDVKLTAPYAGYKSLRERRAIQYSKGALFMDALRRELGDEVFWKAFKAYTRKHRGGVVTTADFQADFERSSGRRLTPLFAAWAY